jgi:hypothetical protein
MRRSNVAERQLHATVAMVLGIMLVTAKQSRRPRSSPSRARDSQVKKQRMNGLWIAVLKPR